MTTKLCEVDSCPKEVRRRTYCFAHYQKYMKYGDPLAGGIHYETPEEAFAARTVWQGDCLVWTGSVDASGYGTIRVKGKTIKVHRFAYEMYVAPIPAGLFLDHRCHNRRCANDSHLRPVTNKQNMENRKPNKGSTSGVKGVSWVRHVNKWVGRVYDHKKEYRAGYFAQLEEARLATIALRSLLHTHNDQDPEPTERGFELLRQHSRLDVDKLLEERYARNG